MSTLNYFMNKKIIYIILIIVLMVAIVSSGIFFYNKYRLNKKNAIQNDAGNPINAEFQVITLPSEPVTPPQWYATDKDGDGLTDDEETKLGTDKWEPDSDFDEISDKLEIEKYKTDPLNPDTDGDSYRDGLEIVNGFDPLKK